MPEEIEDIGNTSDRDGQTPVPGTKARGREIRPLEDSLTEPQRRALTMIVNGKPFGEAAREVGINRTTLYRWMRLDPQFRAAYNAWQMEQREDCRAALLRCGQEAVAKISKMVSIDQDTAWKVIKELGLFRDSPALPTELANVRREIEIEKNEQEDALEQRRTGLAMPGLLQRMLEAQGR
jgi:transposase-like protein